MPDGDNALELNGVDSLHGLKPGILYATLAVQLMQEIKAVGLIRKLVSIFWLVEANTGITQVELSRFLASVAPQCNSSTARCLSGYCSALTGWATATRERAV